MSYIHFWEHFWELTRHVYFDIYIIHNTFDMRDIQPSYDIFIGLSEMGYAMVYRYTLQMAYLMGHRHHIFRQTQFCRERSHNRMGYNGIS